MKANIKTLQNSRLKANAIAILFLATLFNCLYAKAQTAKNFNSTRPFSFEENKGQLKNESGNTATDIKFYGNQGGVYVYCKPGMLSFVFTKIEKKSNDVSEATGMSVSGVGVQNPEPLHLKDPFGRSALSALRSSTSRMDLVLINSNPNPEITASDQQEYFENFYNTGDANNGITNVHTYKTVTYKNVYPHVDMILTVIPSSAKASAGKEGMEYS